VQCIHSLDRLRRGQAVFRLCAAFGAPFLKSERLYGI
jgi:hypothetical protein